MRILLLLVTLLVALVVAGFAMLNAQVVPLNYFFGDIELPLVAIILLSFVSGALIAGLSFAGPLLSRSMQNRRLKSHLHKLEQNQKGQTAHQA